MLPVLDWDEENTLVHDRSAISPLPVVPGEKLPRRQATSGVVPVGDWRQTVVMSPEEAAAPEGSSPEGSSPEGSFDPRGTVRMEESSEAACSHEGQRSARLRRTTVRATRDEIFGKASAASWDEREPEVHARSRFDAIAAKLVAAGARLEAQLEGGAPRAAEAPVETPASAHEPAHDALPAEAAVATPSQPENVVASGERLRRVTPEAIETPPPRERVQVLDVRKTVLGMPRAPSEVPAVPPTLSDPSLALRAPAPLAIVDVAEAQRARLRRRTQIAALATAAVVLVAIIVLAALAWL